METMKVEVVSKVTIQPYSPTPHHLRRFTFTILDQYAPSVYMPILLFYSDTPGPGQKPNVVEAISTRLKLSLSKTMSLFYPFAGKVKENVSAECTDDGVDYFEARVTGTSVKEMLEHPELEALKLLLPAELVSPEAFHGRLLSVQSSFFEGGGLAIGICMTHKFSDMFTMRLFLNSWAALAADVPESEQPMAPDFKSSAILPPSETLTGFRPVKMLSPKRKCIKKRFVFEATKVDVLKARAASEKVTKPSRVEAVSALLWKCAMAAASSGRSMTAPSRSILGQNVNIRTRTDPPLPPNSIGNLVCYFIAKKDETDDDHDDSRKDLLPELVAKLRDGIERFNSKYAKKLNGPDSLTTILELAREGEALKGEVGYDVYWVTSMCKFGFYGVDFGWGMPEWVVVTGVERKNLFALMDRRDEAGVEAWVTLSEEEMVLFERDPELLQFATPKASAWPGSLDGTS